MLTVCCIALILCCCFLTYDLLMLKRKVKDLRHDLDVLANFGLKCLREQMQHE